VKQGALVLLAIVLVAAACPADAQTVGEVFRAVTPSVVVVRAKGREVSANGAETHFDETGAGVLISPGGDVMTAAHVVHAMDEVTVEFMGGESVPARVVASEPGADLSLLRLTRVPTGARAARLADSDTVRVGDQVIIVGAPYGLSHSLSVGWISARWPPNSVYRAMPLAEFFQTDAVINTGNSGGPMFGLTGDVVGIVSHNISKSGGSEGLGFVVTANTARQLLLERRSVWTGLEGQLLTDRQGDILNLPPGQLGYLVKIVAKGSLGETLGLRGGTTTATIDGERLVVGGDIVLSVAGIAVNTAADLARIRQTLNELGTGQPFTMTVLRAGRVLDLAGRTP
jgi:S1-C subfamily serine protease